MKRTFGVKRTIALILAALVLAMSVTGCSGLFKSKKDKEDRKSSIQRN